MIINKNIISLTAKSLYAGRAPHIFLYLSKSGGNIKDTLVGRLAKQQRTNNIKQSIVEM